MTTGIDHVGLTVLDLEASRQFFCGCLGWNVVGGNPSYPAVFVSDGHDRITLWQVQGAVYTEFDRKKNLGLHHLALKVSDIESLNILFRKVSMWPGVAVEFAPEPVGKGPKVHFMVAAPGGIRLEFACQPQNS
ncbi:VOC family protein [Bradyrhizobium sp. NAS80.1]|uniref:VOC family protein n=1 Tax=Bradyrhizobium sp. NAS80.1 TaxID=1680159 RepID=UPI001FD98F85|nr:VOC family protein [Bradyrhizobium sp. NAS80.1]